MRGSIIGGAALALLASTIGVSSASATSGPVTTCSDKVYSPQCPANDATLQASVTSVNNTGVMTPTDQAIWLSRPESEVLIDPTKTETGESTTEIDQVPDTLDVTTTSLASSSRTASIAAASYATRTKVKDRYIRFNTTVRTLCYEWHTTVTWNYNGTKVTSTPSRSNYIVSGRGCAGTLTNKGWTTNTASAHYPGPYAYRVTLQGEVKQCVPKLFCQTDNPGVRYGVYKDGTYSYVVFQKS